ncbi:MAG: phosphate signaling complex protein PhoU [Oscillospiraceae bacterium]|nr:phosphate signaling complex protein PhoU [Oscillospiraceae bacterium]
MRNHFDNQLALLNQEMIRMGGLCEEIIELVAKALTGWEDDLLNRVAVLGNGIDESERNIESLCLKLLLQQQPVARDLRVISAAMKMITDMERIGDQAEDIAEIITHLNCRVEHESVQIREMAEATMRMVREAVDAYVKQDLDLAKKVMKHDDIVDDYFVAIKKGLIAIIAANPDDGEYALDLLMIAKYCERIGDHCTNIAEWVEFSVTGQHKSCQ